MLKDKVVKNKKLQSIGGDSLAIVVPSTWIKDMNWTRETILEVAWRPAEGEIIIREKKKIEVFDEKTG